MMPLSQVSALREIVKKDLAITQQDFIRYEAQLEILNKIIDGDQ